MNRESFGSFVKRSRKKLGLTQKELAAQCGLSSKYISVIERDYQPSPEETKEKIRAALSGDHPKAQKKIPKKRSVPLTFDPSTDCTAMVHAIASSNNKVTLDEFFFLLEVQSTLHKQIGPDLVNSLLAHRRGE